MTNMPKILLAAGCFNIGLTCVIAYGDWLYRKYLGGIGHSLGLINPFRSPSLPIPQHKEIARIVAERKRVQRAYETGFKNGQIASRQSKSD